MTDTDKLQVLYNYIKLLEPNSERIYLKDNRIFVDGFGASYMELYCKDSKFTAHSFDLNPNWLHKVFKVYRVSRVSIPFHDRWFLDRICTHILAFEGDGNVFYFEGSYTEYEANKAQRLGLEEPKRNRYRKLMEE